MPTETIQRPQAPEPLDFSELALAAQRLTYHPDGQDPQTVLARILYNCAYVRSSAGREFGLPPTTDRQSNRYPDTATQGDADNLDLLSDLPPEQPDPRLEAFMIFFNACTDGSFFGAIPESADLRLALLANREYQHHRYAALRMRKGDAEYHRRMALASKTALYLLDIASRGFSDAESSEKVQQNLKAA